MNAKNEIDVTYFYIKLDVKNFLIISARVLDDKI